MQLQQMLQHHSCQSQTMLPTMPSWRH